MALGWAVGLREAFFEGRDTLLDAGQDLDSDREVAHVTLELAYVGAVSLDPEVPVRTTM